MNKYFEIKAPDNDDSSRTSKDQLTTAEKKNAKKFAEKHGVSLEDNG